jgi:hypothetical protein
LNYNKVNKKPYASIVAEARLSPYRKKKKKESKLSDALYYWKIKPVHLGD